MARKFRIIVGLVVLSTMFGYLGYVFGVPTTTGPCDKDTTHTCAFACKPVTGDKQYESVAATSTVQIPYCANQKNDCNSNQTTYPCSWIFYKTTDCSGSGTTQTNYVNGCQQ